MSKDSFEIITRYTGTLPAEIDYSADGGKTYHSTMLKALESLIPESERKSNE